MVALSYSLKIGFKHVLQVISISFGLLMFLFWLSVVFTFFLLFLAGYYFFEFFAVAKKTSYQNKNGGFMTKLTPTPSSIFTTLR